MENRPTWGHPREGSSSDQQGDRRRPTSEGPEARPTSTTSSGSKARPENVSVPMRLVSECKGHSVAVMTTDMSVYTGTVEEYDEGTMNILLVKVDVKRPDGVSTTVDSVFLRGDKILTISMHPVMEEHPLVKAFAKLAEEYMAAEKIKEDEAATGPRAGGPRGGGGGFGGPRDGGWSSGRGFRGSGGYGRPYGGGFRR